MWLARALIAFLIQKGMKSLTKTKSSVDLPIFREILR